MIALQDLSMAYGHRVLFMKVNVQFDTPNRYAIVGANGSGKSTLFKLCLNEEEPSEGTIQIPKDTSVGWLKQDQYKYEDVIIRDIVLQGKPRLWAALCEKEGLLNTPEWTDKTGYRLSAVEEIIMHEGGYTAITDAEYILSGLGVDKRYFDKPLKTLSGGYKLRVLLAQTLFQNPSILLLDEPTNHLDILSIAWLEQFLKDKFKGLILFISHDIAFIDKLATIIVDIDYGDIRAYKGNYAHFLDEKNLFQTQKLIERQSLESRIADMQRFVDRFKAKASKAAQARSRMKMIEKIELPDIQHSSRVAPKISFTPKRPSGKNVTRLENLGKRFGENLLFENFNLNIHRGEKIAILGKNGIGKSTLIKMIVGLIKPDSGNCHLGHEVHISYFSQDHHEQLSENSSAIHWLSEASPTVTETQVRQILGQMLFVKDEVKKNILTLSGGESARLLIARIMLAHPNFILLDEPTNHLDLETIEALADALSTYPGTVLFVTHNRHLVEKVATRILYLEGMGIVRDHHGTYATWTLLGN